MKLILLTLMALNASAINIHEMTKILCHVESDNGANKKDGDSGRAVGILQIWKITVDQANKYAGYEKFTYEDRKNDLQSKLICIQVLSGRINHERKYNCKMPIEINLAGSWRSGSLRKKSPKWYLDRYEMKKKKYRKLK